MNYDVTDIQDKTFILGVERSGTTWLGNIFASSPEVDYYPEPFAPRTFLFEEFPDRASYLGSSNPLLTDFLIDEFQKLGDFKYRNGEQFASSVLERKWVHFRKRMNYEVARRSGLGPSISVLRWRHLNLNRRDDSRVLEFRKHGFPSNLVIKEVRNNFHVAGLTEAFRNARFIVVVRNPYAQVDSMLRWIQRGSLQELRGVLSWFLETIADHARFAFAKSAIDALGKRADDELLARCVAYWFVNYTVLLEDLERLDARYTVVRHEDLCERPLAQTRDLMQFAGLSVDEQTREYLESTTSRDRGEVSSPRDTSRDTSRYYMQALRRIPVERIDALESACAEFWPLVPSALREYQQWLSDTLEQLNDSSELQA